MGRLRSMGWVAAGGIGVALMIGVGGPQLAAARQPHHPHQPHNPKPRSPSDAGQPVDEGGPLNQTFVEERTIQPSLDKFLSVITKDGGTLENVDLWGKRRLAYDIKKKSEGIYAVVNFSAESATAKELDRQLGLNESILRTKLLRPGA